MNNQNAVVKPGDGFETVGSTKDCEFAALQNLEKKTFQPSVSLRSKGYSLRK